MNRAKQRVLDALVEVFAEANGHLNRIQRALPDASPERCERVLLLLTDIFEDLDMVADLAEGLGEDRLPQRR